MGSRLVLTSLAVLAATPATAVATTIAPPTARISIGMAPASPRAGSDVHLTGGAGAPSYEWDLDDDGQYDDATGLAVTTRFAAGTRTVRARAVTAVGYLVDSRTFTVHDWNVNPSGRVRATPHSARVGTPVTVVAEGRDPDGVHLRTELDLDDDGVFEASGTSGTATFSTPGERVIRARFVDDAGATSIATMTLDVHTGNIAPTVEIPRHLVAPATGAGENPSVPATDPDGELVRYEWDLDGDGTFETDQGRDSRIPAGFRFGKPFGVRVTDDSGATAVTRAVGDPDHLAFPSVVQVGTPVTLTASGSIKDAEWDADGDGAFDDGTGNELSFTYPSAGTYDVRVRGYGTGEHGRTISVRHAGDIAVPRVQPAIPGPVRPGVEYTFGYELSTPTLVNVSADLDGDGAFTDVDRALPLRAAFSGPTTIALKATDEHGRSTRTTTQVPFVPGNLGPDVSMLTWDVKTPLHAPYQRGMLTAGASDPDGGFSQLTAAWDTDADGAFDDTVWFDGTDSKTPVASNFGVRVTDGDGASTTLRRSVTPIEPAIVPAPAAPAWLTLTAKRPKLATLLRRGLIVKVACTRPGCKTRLVATLDAKTARKLKLRSRTVASRTVSGTKQATVKLTPKARRALKRVRSVRLTLTATATANGVRTVSKQTVTIRR